uniref:Hypotheticial protein n=1 Tax=Schistosoma japonicum TaxID=6182 RepID=C7TST5_SCHJA|nr:hypotheticial protein [Schistosoma japonicum]
MKNTNMPRMVITKPNTVEKIAKTKEKVVIMEVMTKNIVKLAVTNQDLVKITAKMLAINDI